MKILDIPARVFDRLLLWLNILKNVRGVSLKMQLGLILSAFIDTSATIVSPSLATLPRVYVSGVTYSKGYDVYFYVRALSDDLYSVMPGREGDVNDLILKVLERGDIFLDAGANVGYYTVLAGRIVGEEGYVIAVEPVPETAKVLELNVKLNKLNSVRIVNKACWNSRSQVTMWVPEGLYCCASTAKAHWGRSFVVDAIPLDDLCRDIRSMKLLKIDVEGSELQVLEGAKETSEKTKYAIIELSENAEQVLELLKQASFKIHKMQFTTHIFAYRD